jgi:5'-deoxynucleotidase YfbR-like HD superfamily hydrolase
MSPGLNATTQEFDNAVHAHLIAHINARAGINAGRIAKSALFKQRPEIGPESGAA